MEFAWIMNRARQLDPEAWRAPLNGDFHDRRELSYAQARVELLGRCGEAAERAVVEAALEWNRTGEDEGLQDAVDALIRLRAAQESRT